MQQEAGIASYTGSRAESRPASDAGLAAALRDRTQDLHRRVERSGIISDVIKGQVEPRDYGLFLRNLWPAYQEMERGLERHRRFPGVRLIALPALYRGEALRQDLRAIAGDGWARSLPLLPEGQAYASRITAVAETDPQRLVGHAYVRYLGDLSGGQILRKILSRSLDLQDDALSFYDFPEIENRDCFKANFRSALDQAAFEVPDSSAIVGEARLAFQLNIRVSAAVQRALQASRLPEPQALEKPCV